jgi:hypothetical protein
MYIWTVAAIASWSSIGVPARTGCCCLVRIAALLTWCRIRRGAGMETVIAGFCRMVAAKAVQRARLTVRRS